jgi:hypothetical protein
VRSFPDWFGAGERAIYCEWKWWWARGFPLPSAAGDLHSLIFYSAFSFLFSIFFTTSGTFFTFSLDVFSTTGQPFPNKPA